MKILFPIFALVTQFESFSQTTENQIYSVVLNSYKPYNKSKMIADSSMDKNYAMVGFYIKSDGYEEKLNKFLKSNQEWLSIIKELPNTFPQGKIAINRNLKLKGDFDFYKHNDFDSIRGKPNKGPESWWESFYEIYPKSQGIFNLSKIYFPEKNKAIVILWKKSGYDEGVEDLKLLEFKNNKWKLIYTHRMLDGF
jgi:hypothetical protein